MKLSKFKSIIRDTPDEIKEEVKIHMDILDRIHELLESKFNGKQKLLADKLGKTEAEVSKWLNGVQNFTIKTIIKLELAFGEQIIAVTTSKDESTFEQCTLRYSGQNARIEVGVKGSLTEVAVDFESQKIYEIIPSRHKALHSNIPDA